MTDLYNGIVQRYLYWNSEKRKLIQEREKISAKLDVIEEMLIDLNDVLCKCGKHIYEHFEEEGDGE